MAANKPKVPQRKRYCFNDHEMTRVMVLRGGKKRMEWLCECVNYVRMEVKK